MHAIVRTVYCISHGHWKLLGIEATGQLPTSYTARRASQNINPSKTNKLHLFQQWEIRSFRIHKGLTKLEK